MPAEVFPWQWLAALFGLATGSFLNVCITRLPRHESVVTPRSRCPQCERGIAWFDNIPLLSFAVLRGRCRGCGKAISWRYPIVELTTAGLFFINVERFGLTLLALKLMIFAALMVTLLWTDLETMLLPQVLTLGGIAAGLILAPFAAVDPVWEFPALPAPWGAELNALLAAVILPAPFLLIAVLYRKIRGVEGAGGGDVLLLALIGAFLGLRAGIVALFLGSVGGTVLGLGYILGTGKSLRTQRLPLGTFLSAAGVIAGYWGTGLLGWWWSGGGGR